MRQLGIFFFVMVLSGCDPKSQSNISYDQDAGLSELVIVARIDNFLTIYETKIEDHSYFVSALWHNRLDAGGGGNSIIHAEHCLCRKNSEGEK